MLLNSKSRITVSAILAVLVGLSSVGVYTPLVSPQAIPEIQHAAKVARFPFELSGNMIFLPVRVNGSKPLSFGLDTGAYLSVINTPIAEQLGLKTGGRSVGFGAGGQVPSLDLPDVSLDINGAVLKDLDLSGMALGSIENSLGRAMDGILGAEFFKRYVVELDYEKKEMTLYEPADYAYS